MTPAVHQNAAFLEICTSPVRFACALVRWPGVLRLGSGYELPMDLQSR